ncbi:MAG: Spore cortex-lytic enzyme precursor [Pelotomaculum sp. PtaU1.Bin035]|nr:MAG: Spore cortex-lytic enzyme precursor [Pelotomaculum sp. PtaU1.Bin035]
MSLAFRILVSFLVSLGGFIAPAGAYAATHTVIPGESLYTISINYGVPLNSLMEANEIQNSLIYPGQQLYVPENDFNGGGASYTVRAGDCLYQIGRRFGVSYQEIMRANGLSDTVIYQGMVLTIPGGAAVRQPVPQISRGGSFQRPSLADVDLLARLITAEADGEPYEGKVAVGAVVLNRVYSAGFPKSIPGVVNQYDNGTYQFEPVMNGWINKPASPQSIQAAKDALNGMDPTNGALYFFASRVKNEWLWSRPLSTIIGNVVFTY